MRYAVWGWLKATLRPLDKRQKVFNRHQLQQGPWFTNLLLGSLRLNSAKSLVIGKIKLHYFLISKTPTNMARQHHPVRQYVGS